jgi:hypothetical protein
MFLPLVDKLWKTKKDGVKHKPSQTLISQCKL